MNKLTLCSCYGETVLNKRNYNSLAFDTDFDLLIYRLWFLFMYKGAGIGCELVVEDREVY